MNLNYYIIAAIVLILVVIVRLLRAWFRGERRERQQIRALQNAIANLDQNVYLVNRYLDRQPRNTPGNNALAVYQNQWHYQAAGLKTILNEEYGILPDQEEGEENA